MYIAEAAALMGDPARANMLAALMDGRALTAKELGLAAGVAASTASGHLAKLVDGRLVAVNPSGRHRYFRLASAAVAQTLESLMSLGADGPPRYRPRSKADEAMTRARTCYDHLAGRLGVALADSLQSRGKILLEDGGGMLTDAGRAMLGRIGVDLDTGRKTRRPLCRACLDWTERRWHIGGALGSAIAERAFQLGWVERHKHDRALTITPAGELALEELFAVRV
jgi:DNA-binding transcriptional ArsR family regulator